VNKDGGGSGRDEHGFGYLLESRLFSVVLAMSCRGEVKLAMYDPDLIFRYNSN
jgi:hypothetical protein